MGNTVFILGAGASVCAGAPLMTNFLDRARAIHEKRGSSTLEGDFNLIFKVHSALRKDIHSKASLDINNIESLFSTLEMAKILNYLPEELGQAAEVNDFILPMKRFIARTIESGVSWRVSHRKKHLLPAPAHRRFVNLISSLSFEGLNNPQKFSILTFNYDLTMDWALYYKDLVFDYGLEGTIEQNKIPLLKLHGSCNWFLGQTQAKVHSIEMEDIHEDLVSSYFFISEAGTALEDNTTKSILCNPHYREILQTDLKDGEKLEGAPLLVPPTWSKREYYKPIEPVWQLAAQQLRGCNRLCIIGYSLPETDAFFRYLYSLGTAGSEWLERVLVINPDQDSKKRFEDLLGPSLKGRFDFVAEPFEDDEAFKALAKFLGKDTDWARAVANKAEEPLLL